MAKVSPNNDIRPSDDWGLDPRTGLPYSGQAVQTYIKNTLNDKVGAGLFDASEMMLYLFKSETDKSEYEDDPTKTGLVIGSIPLNFETTQYRIRLTPSGSTNINATVNQDNINLSLGLIAESRELGESTWVSTGQDIGVRVYVDANNTGEYVEIPELAQVVLSSVGTLTVDIKPYIPVGFSRVRLYFYTVNGAMFSNSIVYTVTLAEMFIEEFGQDGIGNTWYQAIVEGGSEANYHLGGFKIVGTIPKTIHIRISTTTSVVASYAVDIGSIEAVDTGFFFSRAHGLDLMHPLSELGESLPALETGVYNVKVWLTSGNLSTFDTAITYSVMYVTEEDKDSASLVVMNNSGKDVNNYDESAHLCDYAIYNGGGSTGVPTILITPYIAGTAGTPVTLENSVAAEERQSLNHNISLVTNEENLTIRYRITMDDNHQEGVSRVDNSDIFPSEVGASFYMNTSLRSNGEETRQVVYNTASGSPVPLSSVTWEKMSWVNGIDGWTTDEDGRKCLMLPARTKLIIPDSSFIFFQGDNLTFEFCYRVANVSDYDDNVISIASNPTAEGFLGLRIKPTNITVHTRTDVTSAEDVYQGTNLSDEETVHLLISFQSNFDGKPGYNLVTGYVNGVKNFQFPFASGAWSIPGASAIFGSDSADLYLYSVRAYTRGLSASGAENNWLNSLVTRSEKMSMKELINSILKSSSRQIDYEVIKNSGKYNFFVVEMTSGSENVPSTSYPDGGRANIEMHYGVDASGNSRALWDWKIFDVETKGQGTTSMNYWLWNIRCRIDKTDGTRKRDICYYNEPSVANKVRTFNPKERVNSGTVWFDGEGNHPAVKRITAKINFASSMQSHKMGATRAYNVLHDALEDGAILNEAQVIAEMNGLPMPSVAVYQYPAFGFQKNTNSLGDETYTFIGLFTIGPDKGDKPTFGFDIVENDLVSMEGTDHHPQVARFCIPWDEQMVYNVNSSGDGFLAAKGPNGNNMNGLEVGNAKSAKTENPSQAMPVLVDTFKGAYDAVYGNSTLIFPIALDDDDYGGEDASEVLANINADIETFQKKKYNDRLTYADMEFWIEGDYKLYHYEYETQQYVSGSKVSGSYVPLDILSDTGYSSSEMTGLTLEQQNDLFKQARRDRFVLVAPTFWDMTELAFNYVYLLIFAATDNFAKNQYPYYMGGKWRFRQDDLDTIMDIDNSGGQTKPAYIEFGDTVNGAPYFGGSNSVLWNLVHECLWDDYTSNSIDYPGITTVGREMISTMSLLSGGNNMYDGFIKFFDKYFWGNAQEYFPPSAYNIDGNIKYETAWATGRSFSVPPLRQSLGDHFSAERLWTRRRAVYCMSLFGAGVFGTYEGDYLGRIQFRPVSLGSLTVTPAETMYPCLVVGDNDVRPTERTGGGEEYEFTSLSSQGQTVHTLQAVDYLTSLGDLKDLKLDSQDGGKFSISGKRLREFKMGDATETVTTTVTSLDISTNGLPCLEVVDVRNASDLAGDLNLTGCRRVKEVYAEGTKLSSVSLPRGSKIEKLHLSEYTTSLKYRVVRHLTDLVLPTDKSGISLIYLENCDAFNPYETLYAIYSSTTQNLAYIRIVSDTEKTINGPQFGMLVNIAQNLDKDGGEHIYHRTNADGDGDNYENPYFEGEVVAGKHYASDIELLSGGATPGDSETHTGMKRILASYFSKLYINYPTGALYEYIEFSDSNVRKICATKYGDGYGALYSDVATVTTVGYNFRGNTSITSFDELQYFGLTTVEGGQINNGGAFYNCTKLKSVVLPDSCTTIGAHAFRQCTALESLDFGSSLTSIDTQSFWNCYKLLHIDLPATITSIAHNAFCTSGTTHYRRDVIVRATSVPSLGTNAFKRHNNGAYTLNTSLKIYVPYSSDHSILDAYKAATNWSDYASYIFELDENGNIPE